MFIELTDHLRCPADHDEAFLVLIPNELRDRQVVSGHLGCPVCERSYPIENGVAIFGRMGPEATAPAADAVTADALHAFLGLEGPGGYVLLVGDAGLHAAALSRLLPGVHLVCLNPPDGLADSPVMSRLVAPSIPLKARSVRGVILGGDARQTGWQSEAARVVLPGLRVVGQGELKVGVGLELLASGGGWWVARAVKP